MTGGYYYYGNYCDDVIDLLCEFGLTDAALLFRRDQYRVEGRVR